MPPVWSNPNSIIVRAMALAGDRIVIAGPPDVARKTPNPLAYSNEKDALAGFRGEKGVLLQVVSASNGKMVSTRKLSAMPVFDGLSVAGGKVFISLKDGTVECWGGR